MSARPNPLMCPVASRTVHAPVLVALLTLLALSASAATWGPIEGLTVDASGALRLGDMQISVVHFSADWVCSRQGSAEVVEGELREQGASRWLLEGTFHAREEAVPFAFHQSMERVGQSAFSYRATLSHPTGVESNTLALAIRLPVGVYEEKRILLDGEPLVLAPNALLSSMTKRGVKRVAIPTSRGHVTFEGEFSVMVQDGRGTGHPFFRVRLMFSESRGTIRSASFAATVALRPPTVSCLDIRPTANMGFRDEVDGDGRGGWTDQGENDIRTLEPGRRTFGGIPFDIVDAAKNGGASCLVFAGPGRAYFPKDATVAGDGGTHACLYLLHGTAWTPKEGTAVGEVSACYADGSESRHRVTVGRDVGNWFRPVDLENGVVVWTAANPRSEIGLYLTKVPLEARPLEAVHLSASGEAVWMVVGLSAGEDVPVWQPARRYYMFGDSNWEPFEHRVDTVPGSALDFSFLVDGPAGKHGRVLARNGHFEFADRPGEGVRFYGTNICHLAAYQDKAGCEAVASELARKGYNSARLHHIGAQLPRRGAASSTDFDPERLDQLDYLFHCLKQQGIYVSIDLYTTRTVKAGEIAELDRDVRLNEFKAMMAVSPSAMRNWKTYARNLLTHRNPYTGLAWKDDPALFSICLVNEGTLHAHWNVSPDIKSLYLERYGRWLGQRGTPPETALPESSSEWTEFVTGLNQRLTAECLAYVRGLRPLALITDANYRQVLPLNVLREDLDYVDNHVYWDLKKFLGEKWKLPYGHRQLKDTAHAASTPRRAMPTRLFGKPFTVTEFNYCFPNHFRAEGGPLMGAYAALQDWDGLYRYCYAHQGDRTRESKALYYLENVSDPVNVLSDRIGVLLFLRRDVKPATTQVPYVYSEHVLRAEGMLNRSTGSATDAFSKLGLFARIGAVNLKDLADLDAPAPFTVAAGPTWPHVSDRARVFEDSAQLLGSLSAQELLPASLAQNAAAVLSETGQLRMEAGKGAFTVITEASECFVLGPGQAGQGDAVTVTNGGVHAVVCVAAMDGQGIPASRRLLVLHLTDVMNTGMRFDSEDHTVLGDWGRLPLLVRKATADIRISTRGEDACTVYALDVGGARRGGVPAKQARGTLCLRVATAGDGESCMAYEIVR